MSLFGIGSQTNTMPSYAVSPYAGTVPAYASGGGMLFPGQAAYPGGMIAQSQGGGIGHIIKNMVVFGGIGAALGFGASFFTLPVVGQVAAPIAAAVGGGIGAAIGLVKGLIDNRNSGKLAMQVQPGAGVTPTAMAGKTFKLGASHTSIKTTQRQLKKLGLLQGKVTNRLDKRTADAIARYEVMKGALPTGTSTPELRSLLAQDVRMLNYY